MLGSAVPRGQQMVTAVSSVTLSPSPLMLSWQHCAICEPPHLSQVHPVAAVHVCLCTDPRGHRRPHGVQGPVLLPQHSGWDSHSAICISEKQLECILKTRGGFSPSCGVLVGLAVLDYHLSYFSFMAHNLLCVT